jgi:hypothetical protein
MLVGGAPDYEWLDDAQCYKRLAFDSPMARGELAVGVDLLRKELDSAIAREAAATTASCSAAPSPRGGSSVWPIAVAILVLLASRYTTGAAGP